MNIVDGVLIAALLLVISLILTGFASVEGENDREENEDETR